jgi:hypothetical protein
VSVHLAIVACVMHGIQKTILPLVNLVEMSHLQ